MQRSSSNPRQQPPQLRPAGRQQQQQQQQQQQPQQQQLRPLSRTQSVPAESKVAAAAPALNEAAVRKKSVSTIEEYLGIHDTKEVLTCMGEMARGYGPIFAEEIFNAVVNKKDKDRVLLEQLMVEVVGVPGGIAVNEWSQGLSSIMEFIEDIKIDVPKSDEWLGKMCGRLLDNKTIPMRALENIIKSLRNDVLAMFTWGMIQIYGDVVGDRNVSSSFRKSFAWLSSNVSKDNANKYVSALAQGCPAKGIKAGAQCLLNVEVTDNLDSPSTKETEKADVGYCVGATWAAAHQRGREPKPEQIDLSILPSRSSSCMEQFVLAVYDVAKIDRWKDAQRDERLEALCAKGVVPKQTLDFVRNFNK